MEILSLSQYLVRQLQQRVCVMAAPRRSHNAVKLPSLYLSGLTVLPRTRTIVVSPYVPDTAVRSPTGAIQN